MKKNIQRLAYIWLSIVLMSCSATKHETLLEGKYSPTWQSLSQYKQAPDWFRDAKFGIWAH